MTHFTDIIPAIAEFWIYAAFTLILLPRKYSKTLSYSLITVMSILNGFAIMLPHLAWYRTLVGFTLVAALVLLLFDGKFSKKLVVLVAINVTLILNEFVFAFLFVGTDVVTNYNNLPDAQRATIAIADRVCLALLFILEARIFKRKFDKADDVEYDAGFQSILLICTIPIIMIIIWYRYVVVAVPDARPVGVLLPLFACIFAEIALVLLQITSTKQKTTENELLRLTELTEAQEKYYSALSDSYNETRKMRHDIANHMYTINILLEDGKSDEAAVYAKELSAENQYSSRLGDCRNSVIDAYLYHRIQELEAKGIKTEVKISLPQELNISSCDLISVFGNLLDNAAEACAGIDDAKISVVAELCKNYMYVSVENPTVKTSEAKARRIPELERGLGNRILMSLAEKYDGEFTKAEKDGIYTAKILLKVCN